MNLKSLGATIFFLFAVVGCSAYKDRLFSPDLQSAEFIVLKNVNLVPMTAEKIVHNQTVLIKGKKIVGIGSAKDLSVPPDAEVIEGAGAYLMPGLADMHVHTRDNWDDWLSYWPVSPLHLYLANGVTTIRNFGPEEGARNYVLGWRDKINNGKLIGPHIYTSGPIIYGPVSNPQKTVRKQIKKGYDFIKLYSFLSEEEYYTAMSTAKLAGIYTAGHIPFQVGLEGVLSQGMDEIAHIEELAWEYVDFDKTKKLKGREWLPYVIQTAYGQFKPYLGLHEEELEERFGRAASSLAERVSAADVPVCTTLYLDEVIVEKLFTPQHFLLKPENRYLPRNYIAAFKQGREKHQMQFRGGKDFAPFKRNVDTILLKYLKEAGVRLVLGSDAGTGWMGLVPGFSIHEELRILTENGFSPYEAIKTGTVNAAFVVEKMNGKGDFGTIEIGKRADLILVKNNPLDNVANIRNILGVMAAGRWYSKTSLEQMITLK